MRTSQFLIALAIIALIGIVVILMALPAGKHVSLVKLVILVNLVQFIGLLSDVQSKWYARCATLMSVSDHRSLFPYRPPEIQKIWDTLSIANINLDLIAPGCVATITFYTEMLLTAGIPIFLLLVVVVIYAGFKVIFFIKRRPRARFLQTLRYKGYRSTLIILVLTYILVSKKAFQFFACTSVNGETFLAVDLSVPCYDTTWYVLP